MGWEEEEEEGGGGFEAMEVVERVSVVASDSVAVRECQ